MPITLLGRHTGLPHHIDRYELIAELACGGTASIYLARSTGPRGFQRLFAIKQLHQHLANDPKCIRMLLDEARLLASIRHHHVIPVHEAGTTEHGPYFVMEYIDGDSLCSFMAESFESNEPIPHHIAIRIVLDTLSGLHAAHEHVDPQHRYKGVIHRDVSPQNILVDVHGVSRITDFGLAIAATSSNSTHTRQIQGKIAYMAPEQAQGQNVSPRSDVFSTGIVLWECLANRRLFYASSPATTLQRLVSEPIPNIRDTTPNVPPEICHVVARALSKDPATRHQSALAMAENLTIAARNCNLLGTTADVQDYVHRTIGPTLQQQRIAVRLHLATPTSI